MVINASCKKCGAPWRLVAGVDSIPDDPIVHECPVCDINSLLNNKLNGTQQAIAIVRGIGEFMGRNAKEIQIAAESFKVKP